MSVGPTGRSVSPGRIPERIGNAELPVTATGFAMMTSRKGVSSWNWQPIVTLTFAPGWCRRDVGAGYGVAVVQLMPASRSSIRVWYSEPAAHDAVGFIAA